MKSFKEKSGQSLLETVFAIGILLIVVTAIIALTVANIIGQRESELQIIANNLAREGIEAVRNIRDSNWLSGRDWDSSLVGDGTAVPIFDKTENQWTIDFTPNEAQVIYRALDGSYSHNQTDPADQTTIFRRLLLFKNICQLNNGSEEIKDNCGVEDKKIGLKVEANVLWVEGGRPRQIKLEDLLYAWK